MVTMNKRPRILITNDDGIHAEGLKHLFGGLQEHADIFIVAPAAEQSGVGLGITTRAPLYIEKVDWPEQIPAWSVTGTPADCVKMALSVLLDAPPDLIVSGINRGSNAGRNLLYSGTIGGVIEGVLRGIPGIAFSCTSLTYPNFAVAEKHVHQIVRYVLETPLSEGSFLNVNFPSELPQLKGVRLARQGRSYWMEAPDKRHTPHGAPYYWIGSRYASFEEEKDSDMALLLEGYATAVPVHVGELTDHTLLQSRKDHFEKYFLDT